MTQQFNDKWERNEKQVEVLYRNYSGMTRETQKILHSGYSSSNILHLEYDNGVLPQVQHTKYVPG